MSWEDPIVAEIRQARESHASRFHFDLRAIYQDLKKVEQESGRQIVSFSARRALSISPLNKGSKQNVA